jgi:hypothetical protein
MWSDAVIISDPLWEQVRRTSQGALPLMPREPWAQDGQLSNVQDRRAISLGLQRSVTAAARPLSAQVAERLTADHGDLQAGGQLLPSLLPRPRPATGAGRQVWNTGREYGLMLRAMTCL